MSWVCNCGQRNSEADQECWACQAPVPDDVVVSNTDGQENVGHRFGNTQGSTRASFSQVDSSAAAPQEEDAAAARKALLHRLAEEGRQKERERQEAARRELEARVAAQSKAIEEARAENERVLEARRQAEEQRKAQEARIAEEARLAHEARLAEEVRLAEEARIAEEERKAEEARLAQEARLAEEARKAEEARIAQEARLAEEARKAEQARLAEEEARRREQREAEMRRILEERRREEERRAEEAKLAEEARRFEEELRELQEAREQEEARLAQELRRTEELRLEAEAKLQEEKRLADAAKAEAEARLAEQRRLASEAREAAERRIAEEQRLAEEMRQAQLERIEQEKRLLEELREAQAARIAEQDRLDAELLSVQEERSWDEAVLGTGPGFSETKPFDNIVSPVPAENPSLGKAASPFGAFIAKPNTPADAHEEAETEDGGTADETVVSSVEAPSETNAESAADPDAGEQVHLGNPVSSREPFGFSAVEQPQPFDVDQARSFEVEHPQPFDVEHSAQFEVEHPQPFDVEQSHSFDVGEPTQAIEVPNTAGDNLEAIEPFGSANFSDAGELDWPDLPQFGDVESGEFTDGEFGADEIPTNDKEDSEQATESGEDAPGNRGMPVSGDPFSGDAAVADSFPADFEQIFGDNPAVSKDARSIDALATDSVDREIESDLGGWDQQAFQEAWEQNDPIAPSLSGQLHDRFEAGGFRHGEDNQGLDPHGTSALYGGSDYSGPDYSDDDPYDFPYSDGNGQELKSTEPKEDDFAFDFDNDTSTNFDSNRTPTGWGESESRADNSQLQNSVGVQTASVGSAKPWWEEEGDEVWAELRGELEGSAESFDHHDEALSSPSFHPDYVEEESRAEGEGDYHGESKYSTAVFPEGFTEAFADSYASLYDDETESGLQSSSPGSRNSEKSKNRDGSRRSRRDADRSDSGREIAGREKKDSSEDFLAAILGHRKILAGVAMVAGMAVIGTIVLGLFKSANADSVLGFLTAPKTCAEGRGASGTSSAQMAQLLPIAASGIDAESDLREDGGAVDLGSALQREPDQTKALSNLETTRFVGGYIRNYAPNEPSNAKVVVYEFANAACSVDYYGLNEQVGEEFQVPFGKYSDGALEPAEKGFIANVRMTQENRLIYVSATDSEVEQAKERAIDLAAAVSKKL